MGIHVAQKEEKRPVAAGHPLQFGNGHFVQFLGLGAAPFGPQSPGGIIQIPVKAAGTGIAGEAYAGGVIVMPAQDLGQGPDVWTQASLVPQGHHLRAECIQSRQHGGIGTGCGNMGTDGVLKQGATAGKAIQMRGGQA